MQIPTFDWTQLSGAVLAIGGLGTAAAGLVDTTKAAWGGVSRVGFGYIKKTMATLIPKATRAGTPPALSLESVYGTLRANWMNGMGMADQKSAAKALIKLNLTTATAGQMAAATGVDVKILTSVAEKLIAGNNEALTTQESNEFGRFDVLVSAMLDLAYQRGDQLYRNVCKLVAMGFAVLLGMAGMNSVFGAGHCGKGFLVGLLAVPLAPIAKDVASTIQAGRSIAQFWKK